MTEHIKVDESFIEGIVKQAAWDSLYDNDLSKKEETELTEETTEEEVGKGKNSKYPPGHRSHIPEKDPNHTQSKDFTSQQSYDRVKKNDAEDKAARAKLKAAGKPVGMRRPMRREEEAEVEVEEANKKLKPPIKVKVKTDDSPEGKKKQADDDYDHERKLKMQQSAESVEVHECPLCESILEEELTDEQIMEHVASIQDALTTIEEAGKEPTDAELDAIEAEDDDDDDMEEAMSYDDARNDAEDMKDDPDSAYYDGEESPKKKKKPSKKESVMLKVKELKRVAQEGYSDPNSGVEGEADRAERLKKNGPGKPYKPSPEEVAGKKKSKAEALAKIQARLAKKGKSL